MALTGFGFPRRMIEKLLAIQKIPNLMKNIPTPKLKELDMNITEDKLESILFNHESPDVKAIVYTVNQLINSKRTKAIGSNMSQLLKYVKIGDSGLQSNTFDNMMTLLDYNNYVEDLGKKKKADYSSIIESSELFNNESTRQMFSGLDIITDVAKIPKEFGVILKEYKIKPEYYLDFYSAVYAYVTRNEYEAFMSPQQVTDPKLKDKKIQSILNVVNHLKDFKESFPDNLFLKQLSLNDNNKVIFTEQRKKDDSLINTTMNDFENLLNSDEVVEVKDKYDGRFVTINVSDFANDLAYYSIQSYGFGYNYESFSYIIPPAYYDNHVEYVSTVDNKIKDYINNPTMFNNIFIEYALNNPRNIDLVESTPAVVNLSAMVDELSNFGSFAYQPVDNDKKQFNNVFLFNNKSIMEVDNTLFTELIYRVGKEHIVKIFEKNDKSYYIIANVNKQDNIDYKALNSSLDTTIKLHYPNENKSKQNRLKDYGLFTQEFYLKSFNKGGIKFEPKEVKEITEKGTDTPELTTVLNTEVLSITNISEGKSEIIKLLSDISKTTASSIEDVINGNFKYDNRFLNNFTNVTFDKTNNKITITERNYLENEEQQSLSEVIPMLKEVLNDYNKNKQVEVALPKQTIQPGLDLYKNALTTEEQKEFYEFGKSVLEKHGYNPFPQYVMASAGQMEWSPELVVGKDGQEYKRTNDYNTKIVSYKKKITGTDGAQPRFTYHYYLSNLDGSKITPISPNIINMLERITGQNMSDYDTVLINLYPIGRTLGWHTDVTEDYRNLDRDIISVSIGANADFTFSNTPDNFISGDPTSKYPAQKVLLNSGDVITFGNKSRLITHTVTNVSGNTNLGSIDLSNSNVIVLPKYWNNLVDFSTIVVTLTPIGEYQNLFVEKIEENAVRIKNNLSDNINCYYHVIAERLDVEKNIVEYEGTYKDYPGTNEIHEITAPNK
jgi:alkylated DNA repair dioxygenase AlkB